MDTYYELKHGIYSPRDKDFNFVVFGVYSTLAEAKKNVTTWHGRPWMIVECKVVSKGNVPEVQK